MESCSNKHIYLCLAHMSEDGVEQQYIKKAFDDNYVVPLGPNVEQFEKELERFVNGKDTLRNMSWHYRPERRHCILHWRYWEWVQAMKCWCRVSPSALQ